MWEIALRFSPGLPSGWIGIERSGQGLLSERPARRVSNPTRGLTLSFIAFREAAASLSVIPFRCSSLRSDALTAGATPGVQMFELGLGLGLAIGSRINDAPEIIVIPPPAVSHPTSPTLKTTQGQILCQSPTDATSSRQHLYGS